MESKFELLRQRAFEVLEMHGFNVSDGDVSACPYELILEAGLKELVGSKNVSFRLDLPRKTNWKDSSTRLRLRLRGLLLRNSTIIT